MPAKKIIKSEVEPVAVEVKASTARPKSASKAKDVEVVAPKVVAPKAAAKVAVPKAVKALSKKVDVEEEPKKKDEKKEEVKVPKLPVSKDTITADYESLEKKLEDIIDAIKASGQKNAGIANWKSTLKNVRALHLDSNKILKIRRHNKQASNNGGFHKEVPITAELSKFAAANSADVSKVIKKLVDDKETPYPVEKYTDWKPSDWVVNENVTRSKVTKFMCDYVRAKALQKKDNKREFVADANLKALFKLKDNDKDNNGKPINYCTLQQMLKQHYPVVVKA